MGEHGEGGLPAKPTSPIRRVELVDKQTWAERWLRPILVAAMPAVIAVWGAWSADQNRAALKDAEKVLQDTREELEKARRELKTYAGEEAKRQARAEVESSNEARIMVAREMVKKEKAAKPWPFAAGAPLAEDHVNRIPEVAEVREIPERYMEQAVAEWRAKKGE